MLKSNDLDLSSMTKHFKYEYNRGKLQQVRV